MASLLHNLAAKFAALIALIRFRTRLTRLALTIHPIAGGSPDGDDDPESGKDEPAGSGDDDPESGKDEPAGSGDDDDPDDEKDSAREPDWKRMARKHEREAKKARKEAEQLRERLQARADADKSEQEKAIDEAEKRARTELEKKFDIERQQDRLELATTKLAGKGLKVGSGDDAKTVRFTDPDDALLHLERDIRNGDLDREDIFGTDGRVRTEALEGALIDLLERKPHLADGAGGAKKVSGTADARKGQAPKSDSTVEDHFKKIRRRTAA